MSRVNEEWEFETGYLTATTAAKYVPFSPHTIKKLCLEGELKFIEIGSKQRVIRRVSVRDLIRLCLERGIKIHPRLTEAYREYRRRDI